jgi:hypothetical protein
VQVTVMLSPSTRLRLQSIVARIGRDEPVSLQERIEIQKFADHNATVAGWLRQARRRRCQSAPMDGVDRLLHDLNLGPADPEERHRPGQDDLGEWFGGAPGWLRRS